MISRFARKSHCVCPVSNVRDPMMARRDSTPTSIAGIIASSFCFIGSMVPNRDLVEANQSVFPRLWRLAGNVLTGEIICPSPSCGRPEYDGRCLYPSPSPFPRTPLLLLLLLPLAPALNALLLLRLSPLKEDQRWQLKPTL
jgi:hypothetical protein